MEAGDCWIEDPKQGGLRLAGYPNPDGAGPDIVGVYWPRPSKPVVVILAAGLHDDSGEATKVRVSLVQRGDQWEMEWAGGQWFWAPSPCSSLALAPAVGHNQSPAHLVCWLTQFQADPSLTEPPPGTPIRKHTQRERWAVPLHSATRVNAARSN